MPGPGRKSGERTRRFEWRVIKIPFTMVHVTVYLAVLVVGGVLLFHYRAHLPRPRLPAAVGAFLRDLGFSVGKPTAGETPSGTFMEQRFATLSFLDGEVKVQRAKDLDWITADSKMRLETGDRVRTFGGARAEVLFDDGSNLKIKPDSLIIIGDLTENVKTKQRQSSVRLLVSSIEADIKKQVVEGSKFRIEMPSATAEMGKAKISVNVGPKDESTVKVFDGQATVDTGAQKVAMNEHSQVSVDAGRRLTAVSQILPAPRIAAPRSLTRFFVNDLSRASFSLQWGPVPRAMAYRVQIDADRRFSRPRIDRGDLKGTEFRVSDLPAGIWYARVTSLDAAVQEGGTSDPVAFMIVLDRTPPEVRIEKFVSSRASGGYDIFVEGSTEPLAALNLAGRPQVVDERGHFSATVRGVPGSGGGIPLVVRDEAGNEKTLSLKVGGG